MAECQWISPEDASPKSLLKPLGTSWALQGWGCFIFSFHLKHLRKLNKWSCTTIWTFASFFDLSGIFVDLAAVYFISKWGICWLELVNLVCICLTLYFIYFVTVNMSHPATAWLWNYPSLSGSSALLSIFVSSILLLYCLLHNLQDLKYRKKNDKNSSIILVFIPNL